MLVILIIGIAIIAASSGVSFNKKTDAAADNYGEEERLSEILSQINGAGEVSVMMTYTAGGAKDGMFGSDKVYPEVLGVIVIADGAENPTVRQALKEAASAVTGASANHVCVYTRKQ